MFKNTFIDDVHIICLQFTGSTKVSHLDGSKCVECIYQCKKMFVINGNDAFRKVQCRPKFWCKVSPHILCWFWKLCCYHLPLYWIWLWHLMMYIQNYLNYKGQVLLFHLNRDQRISRSDPSTQPLASQSSNTPTPHPRVQALKYRKSDNQTEEEEAKCKCSRATAIGHSKPQHSQPQHVTIYSKREWQNVLIFGLSLVPKLRRLLPQNQTRALVHILTYLSELKGEKTCNKATLTNHPFTRNQLPHSYGFLQYRPTYPHHQNHTPQINTFFSKIWPTTRFIYGRNIIANASNI